MKTNLRLIFLVIFLWMSSSVQAQWINSITIQPANPTSADSVTILVNCSFPSAGCSEHTQFIFVNGNQINASALHCMGLLTMICNYTDTFEIGPLALGNYNFNFQIDAGFGPSPCTPGIVPGVTDSISFVVGPANGIDENDLTNKIFTFPNPTTEIFHINGLNNSEFPVRFQLLNSEGKLFRDKEIKNPDQYISLKGIPDARYLVRLITANNKLINLSILKN